MVNDENIPETQNETFNKYNQVRIIELVRASRSVCVNVRRSTIDKCEEVNV